MKRWFLLTLVALIPLAMIGLPMMSPGAVSGPSEWEWKQPSRIAGSPGHPDFRPEVLPEVAVSPLPRARAIPFCGQQVALGATEVTCNRPEVTDLSPLLALDRLEWVNLRHSGVRNLTPLIHHRKTLWALDLCHTHVRDLAVVGRLDRLERLYLRDTPVRDLTPVAHCRKLRELDIRETPVRSLWPLARLTGLEALALRDNPVRDLRPLSDLRNLTVLYLNGTAVRDLAPLHRLRSLEVLGLTRTRVRDLSPLSRLNRLQLIYLADTPVQSLRSLRRNRELRVLGLSNTRVRDLSPMRGMTELQTIAVDHDPSLVGQARALRRTAPELEVLSDCVGAHNHCTRDR